MARVPGGGVPQIAAATGQPPGAAARWAAGRRLYLPTFAVAVVAGWLAWTGWAELSEDSPVAAIHSAQLELAGPAVLCFVLVVFVIEQIRVVLVIEIVGVVLTAFTAWLMTWDARAKG